MNFPEFTYDQLVALLKHQSKMIFEQDQMIKRLEKKIAKFEGTVTPHSPNSTPLTSIDQKDVKDAPKKKRQPKARSSKGSLPLILKKSK
ncbi:hypothetical protein [Rhabdochlamydiaceae symbiont of Dictyostelium giganteum]|uniref:hypothetical protein n=1 Tax=Rhabdochlamydiaceae symbiont of Dictyostelium giganteum TaxID=3342349 RepID=UPI00384B40F7